MVGQFRPERSCQNVPAKSSAGSEHTPWPAGARVRSLWHSNAIIADLDARGAKVVISQHPRRAKPRAIDEEMYKWRHLIENFFGKLKEFKRIALRADKTDQSFAAMIHIAAAMIHSR
jgi:transposase